AETRKLELNSLAMSAKRLLMLVGDYVEDYEAMVPFQMLQLVGHEVHAVCPGKTAGQTVATAIHDFEGEQTYSEKRGHNFRLNATFAEIRPEQYDALVIPGGRSPEYLRLVPRVITLVRPFLDNTKPIRALCQGRQVLGAVDVLRGRPSRPFPAVTPDMEAVGGRWAEPSAGMDNAHVDGNLVTAAAWPAHAAWMRFFLKVLGTPVGT